MQKYLAKPFLIDGFKVDFRIYVLVTACDPTFRVYMYEDGLARLATSKYRQPTQKNLNEVFCHLTNYSINKSSSNFVKTDDAGSGSKRKLSWFWQHLRENGYPVDSIRAAVDDLVIKTLFSAEDVVRHNYRAAYPTHQAGPSACFEILGFDVMLDQSLKPWLIEVNRSPSFSCDSSVDAEVKDGALAWRSGAGSSGSA